MADNFFKVKNGLNLPTLDLDPTATPPTNSATGDMAFFSGKLYIHNGTSWVIKPGSGSTGLIVNADIDATAAISHSKLANVTSAQLLVGSSTGVLTARSITGDVTISNTGVTSIGSGVIVNADVAAAAAIAGTKISPNFGSNDVITTGAGRFGASGFLFTSSEKLSILGSGGIGAFKTTSSFGELYFIDSANTIRGSINWTAAGTIYGTVSDYRLKYDVKPMTDALTKIKLLKPCVYKWRSNNSDGEGFIAHELAEVCPTAVSGKKDQVNSDGAILPQGVDLSKLVGLLTAGIQEQQQQIESLKAEIAALKVQP